MMSMSAKPLCSFSWVSSAQRGGTKERRGNEQSSQMVVTALNNTLPYSWISVWLVRRFEVHLTVQLSSMAPPQCAPQEADPPHPPLLPPVSLTGDSWQEGVVEQRPRHRLDVLRSGAASAAVHRRAGDGPAGHVGGLVERGKGRGGEGERAALRGAGTHSARGHRNTSRQRESRNSHRHQGPSTASLPVHALHSQLQPLLRLRLVSSSTHESMQMTRPSLSCYALLLSPCSPASLPPAGWGAQQCRTASPLR